MRRKVAIVVPSLRGGGAERVITNLVRHFDQRKFDIRLILIKKEGPYVSLIPNSIPIIDLNSSRVRYSIFKLVKSLNEFKPDIVLSTLGHLNLFLLGIRKMLKGNPKIIVRHANSPTKSLEKTSKLKRTVLKLLYKYFYKKSDKVIAQCHEMKEEIASVFKIEKSQIEFIYNPLDLKKVKQDSKETNPYNKDKINLLAAGRLTYQKGFDILLKSFKIVNDKYPRTHLTILGEGNQKENLLSLAKELDISTKVSFQGFKKNPYPFYYNADMYILSSRFEGFPNTLLEAMACGTKVVATNCSSGPKEILKDNQYGILVEVEDYQSLASGINEYLLMENRTNTRAEFFHINKIAKEYEALF